MDDFQKDKKITMMHTWDSEQLDLVDEEDTVIATITRTRAHEEGLKNIRAVNAFIRNDQGQLWIPRRSANKRSYPLGLDMSVGGLVMSGETYEQALIRETMEEVGIDLTKTPYRFLFKLTPHEHGMNAFQQVYEIMSNEEPDYNKEDFCEAFWLSPQGVLDLLASGEDSKADLPILIKKVYLS